MKLRAIAAAVFLGLTLTACETTSTGVVVSQAVYDRNVLIVNQSGRTIYRFYGSNVGTSSWEEDILGSSVLAPGRSVNINFDDGSGYCNFDFLIEFADGSQFTERNINVCEVGTYTIR